MALTLTPARQDIVCCAGDDMSIAVTVTENGSAYSFTGATVTTAISTSQGGAAVATNFTQGIASNVLTLSLSDTETTTLGVATYWYYVQVTKAGLSRTWFAGMLTVRTRDDGATTTSSSSTLAITDEDISLAITVAGASAAAGVPTGGASGSVLGKSSATDYATAWVTRATLAADTEFSSRYATFAQGATADAASAGLAAEVTNRVADVDAEEAARIAADSALTASVAGRVSKAGGDTVTASALGVIPLVLKGAASQTANLQQWQNSGGTVLASVNSGGDLYTIASVFTQYVQDTAQTGAYLRLLSGAGMMIVNRLAAQIPLKIQGAASQSANLEEWQNSAATALASISSTGLLTVAGITLSDATNIALNTTTGTKIGTATTQKLGFWNATPVVQPTAVIDATDAPSVITQLNALLAKLRTIGLIAA